MLTQKANVGIQARATIMAIGWLARVSDRAHVARALGKLTAAGLHHQARNDWQVTRWITWPPPSVAKDDNNIHIQRKEWVERELEGRNHPDDLDELIMYCESIGWEIDPSEAEQMQDYYAPPGSDGDWRDRYGHWVKDWHRCCVIWRDNSQAAAGRKGPRREASEQ